MTEPTVSTPHAVRVVVSILADIQRGLEAFAATEKLLHDAVDMQLLPDGTATPLLKIHHDLVRGALDGAVAAAASRLVRIARGGATLNLVTDQVGVGRVDEALRVALQAFVERVRKPQTYANAVSAVRAEVDDAAAGRAR